MILFCSYNAVGFIAFCYGLNNSMVNEIHWLFLSSPQTYCDKYCIAMVIKGVWENNCDSADTETSIEMEDQQLPDYLHY